MAQNDSTPKWDRKIIATLVACLISNTSYIIIAPFLPLEFKSKGVDADVTGLIFAAYPVASIATSLILAKWKFQLDSSVKISVGLFFMGLCFIAFGMTHYINSPALISWLGIAIRLLQGASSGCINTTAYGIAANEYSDQTERLVGLLEMMAGLGTSVGPVLGAAIFAELDYAGCFYVFGVFNMVSAFVLLQVYPKEAP